MFGLEYLLAFIKVAFNVAFAIVSAVPFYFSWNCVAPKYLTFIPATYHHLPYWHVVAFFLICTFVGEQIAKLVPSFISVRQSNSNDK